MTILCTSLFFVAAVVYLVTVRLVCENRGYEQGHKAGYEAGRTDEAYWWLMIESDVRGKGKVQR
jgi:hypothetical protein